MATRSVEWKPAGGWEAYTHSVEVEELAWEVLAGWHYINPTAATSVWESPSGATAYLAFDEDRALIEVVLGAADDADPELEDFARRLRRLGLAPG